MTLGQVSAVTKGQQGSIWVLHRGDRVWDAQTFEKGGAGERTLYTQAIQEDTVLQLDQDIGRGLAPGQPALSLPAPSVATCL